ncbi:TPA: hypothetical protein N0F65_012326 [Lagenidium giganteum]|uniref:Glyceraldehyde 3-phosphate dehydrogenase NAD(P) binding domain-containing protein n=1 Tax=Lagenidium giganteum TaxID=4803 RepID=A0AAV2YW01_9STRA|nr:TPA: hypothetical protein N0F65_012326 [Lagenidium giganteum]
MRTPTRQAPPKHRDATANTARTTTTMADDAPNTAALTGEQIQTLRTEELEQWKAQEDAADLMIPLVGRLYRQQNIVSTLFGKGLVHKNSIELIKLHNYVCKYVGKRMVTDDTLVVLTALSRHAPHARDMRIDFGRTFLLVEHLVRAVQEQTTEEAKNAKIAELGRFLDGKLANLISSLATSPSSAMTKPRDVVLYGFGRIGRLLARLLIEKSGPGVKLMLRAIVVRKGTKEDLVKRASLLRRDSVHGPFHGTIRFNEEANAFIANGNLIQVIYADGPDKCDYTQYGINDAVVIDNTGRWRDENGLGLHLKSPGVSKVILTAPAKGNIPTIVAGVNDEQIRPEHDIFSAASCTTNAIAPTLKALDEKYGVLSGHIETVHSFTNDQNLSDNYHQKERRGRSAVLNMVITETGAASAVVKCLPSLKDKLTANAIRVPTPNVSLAILNLELDPAKAKDLTVKELNTLMSKVSLNSPLMNQIDFVNSAEVASTDFVGSRAAGTVDGKATIVKGNRVVLYVWYDNEFGYSCQVVRVLQTLAGIIHTRFPDKLESNQPSHRRTTHARRRTDRDGSELTEIKQSVQRLKTQRAHVEYLRQHAERLEALVKERTQENESLRREVSALRGVEHENTTLLQRLQLLEARIASLESVCTDKRQELKAALDRLAQTEQQREQLRLEVEHVQDEARHHTEVWEREKATLQQQLQNTQTHTRAQDETLQQCKHEHRRQLEALQARHDTERVQMHEQLKRLRSDNQRQTRELQTQEDQVRKLLHTTTRQTGIIDDCDRALAAAKARNDQLERTLDSTESENKVLQERVTDLETQVAGLSASASADQRHAEREIQELQIKLMKRKERMEVLQVALREQEKSLEAVQREHAARDQARANLEDVVQDLRRRERDLQSEVSSLQLAVREATDEKCLLQDQVMTLQTQLATERTDRSKWATARLKLLAEFCDEENKLGSTLQEWLRSDRKARRGAVEISDDLDLDLDNNDADESDTSREQRSRMVYG